MILTSATRGLKKLLHKKPPEVQKPKANRVPNHQGDTVRALCHDTVRRADLEPARPVVSPPAPAHQPDSARQQGCDVPSKNEMPVACERRSEPRQQMNLPAIVIAVLPDGSPDKNNYVSGTCVDLSCQGIGLELRAEADFPTGSVIVLVRVPSGDLRCTAMEVVYTQSKTPGRIRVGGPFGGFAEQILLVNNLEPAFRYSKMEFLLGMPDAVLRKWVEIGALRQVPQDRVQLCPKCHGLPTFRAACPSCGSARTTNDRLIHHFACAHVGFASDFENAGQLLCPKCRTRQLVIGSDYEFMTGPYRCLDCHWSDVELEQVAHCLRCKFRFPGHQAYEQELRGYRVNRLDPLALLSAHRPAPGLAQRPASGGCAPLRPQ